MVDETAATSQGVELVEVDDFDSAYGDEIESYTTSLNSSIKDHSYENGRRYHAYKSGSTSSFLPSSLKHGLETDYYQETLTYIPKILEYLGPNDEAESDRMDMHHHLSTLLLEGKLHSAPIGDTPHRVLDIGTGTGIWAIEFADAFPSAEVLGVDLSSTQPSMVPPNLRFEVDDIEESWTYSQPFDYIHSRFMSGSIADWPKLMGEIFENTKPGGWVEFKDWDFNLVSPDSSIPKDSSLLKYFELVDEGCTKVGRVFSAGPKIKSWVTDAGFVDVKENILTVPLGMWPKDKKLKELGAWNYTCLVEGLEAIILRIATQVLGWSTEEVQVLLTDVRKELKNKDIHTQWRYHVVYAQKPEK